MLATVQTTHVNKELDEKLATEFNLITELLKNSDKMNGLPEESFCDLSVYMRRETSEVAAMDSPSSSKSAASPDLGLPCDFDFNEWLEDIPYDDLLGKKEKAPSATKTKSLVSEALYGPAALADKVVNSSVLDFKNIMTSLAVQPDKIIASGNQYQYVVAPLKVQPNYAPRTVLAELTLPLTTPTPPVPTHKRKEPHFARAVPSITIEEIDIKPMLATTPSPTTGRGRKRVYSGASSTNDQVLLNSKKPKKYEQTDDDPTVRNAKAAKANREKKKQEINLMKVEADKKDKYIMELLSKLEQEKLEKEKYKMERDAARESNVMIQGLRGVATNIREFIQCVIPPMNSAFGGMDVQIPTWFSEVSLEAGALTEIDPAVQARFDLPPDQEPSRFFTAHVNLPDRVVKIEYNPRN